MVSSNRRCAVAALAGLVVVAATPAAAVKRRAFATSVTGSGNIATWPGASGANVLHMADSVCQARAALAGLPNAATYRAWISTTTTDAYCHVQGLTGTKATSCGGAAQPGGGPWYLVNGITTFTASLDQLTGPPYAIYRPVIFDENGNEIVEGDLMTGTAYTGTSWVVGTCGNWTSSSGSATVGNSSATAVRWTGGIAGTCSGPNHLLCLEPGPSEVTKQGWSPSAIVFVTSASGGGDLSTWPQANGLSGVSAGDRICRNLAAAAGLPSPASFVAWLSDGAVDAVDRLTTGGPFRRIDGYPFAFSVADLVDGLASTSLHVDERGAYLTGSLYGAWTGTAGDGTALAENCVDWTSGSPALDGVVGLPHIARSDDWTDRGDDVCDHDQRLYCLSNVITLFWDGFEYTGNLGRWSAAVP